MPRHPRATVARHGFGNLRQPVINPASFQLFAIAFNIIKPAGSIAHGFRLTHRAGHLGRHPHGFQALLVCASILSKGTEIIAPA